MTGDFRIGTYGWRYEPLRGGYSDGDIAGWAKKIDAWSDGPLSFNIPKGLNSPSLT